MDGQLRSLGGVGLPTSGGPWVEGTWDNSNTWSNDGQNAITNNVSGFVWHLVLTMKKKTHRVSTVPYMLQRPYNKMLFSHLRTMTIATPGQPTGS